MISALITGYAIAGFSLRVDQCPTAPERLLEIIAKADMFFEFENRQHQSRFKAEVATPRPNLIKPTVPTPAYDETTNPAPLISCNDESWPSIFCCYTRFLSSRF